MLEKLQEIVRKFTDDENVTITGDTILLSDLALNSYELIRVICEVEDVFDVEIPDRAISTLKTVQNVIDYISAHE